MQGGVGTVAVVGVEEEGRVGMDEAADEERVVEVDGAAEARGGVDPGQVLADCWMDGANRIVHVGDMVSNSRFWLQSSFILYQPISPMA